MSYVYERTERTMRRATIERERRRIEAAFCAALIAASAAAVVEACGSNGDGSSASPDGSAGGDSAGGETNDSIDAGDALADTRADGASAADVLNCAPTFFILDGATLANLGAMPDADLCDLVEPCGMPQGLATQGCIVIEAELDGSPIPDSGFGCSIAVGHGCVNGAYVPQPGPSVEFTCSCDQFIQGGRRTGRARRGDRARTVQSLGAFLAAMAREERASIVAFERLATELASHGAPMRLVRAATRARGDEVRHAASMARLARLRGGSIERDDDPSERSIRNIEAIARENAVEGCVRETFAALLARWQAAHAEDGAVRSAFARIAGDEARHAALAWAVAAWADERLDSSACSRVARARRDAARAMAQSLGGEIDVAVRRAAGVPTPREARALFDEMMRALGA